MKSKSMPIVLFLGVLSYTSLWGQNVDFPPPDKPDGPAKLESALWALAAPRAGKPVSNVQDTVVVILVPHLGQGSASIDTSSLAALGGTVRAQSKSLMRVSVPAVSLLAVSELPGVRFVRRPNRLHPQQIAQQTVSEGVRITKAYDNHRNGVRGQGVKVAIIDSGFEGADQLGSNLPTDVKYFDFTGDGMYKGNRHGTACAEIIYDMAPEAELTLLRIGDFVDVENAKDFCIREGIDIVSHSMSWPDGFGDGRGLACDIVNDAADNGILWVNIAGNAAERHYEGVWSDPDGDRWHDFGSQDKLLSFKAEAGDDIYVYLTWDDWPISYQDYDLYLYFVNADGNSEKVGESTAAQYGSGGEPYEDFSITAQKSGNYGISVYLDDNVSARPMKLKIFLFGSDLAEYAVAKRSILSPGDARGAMTVGAIDYNDYDLGRVEDYSSRGPTTDGRIKPDLSAPDGVSTVSYGAFWGTSAAAPHVAGAAALIKSANPSYSRDQLWDALIAAAVDLGPTGKDNYTGYGKLVLPIMQVASSDDTESTPTNDAPIGYDETLSENITLSVRPSEIKEDAGETTVTVTGTLDSQGLDVDVPLTLVLDHASDQAATRDVDYLARLTTLTIPRGSVSGTATITITPLPDEQADHDETITLTLLTDDLTNQAGAPIAVHTATITLKDVVMPTDPDAPAIPGRPRFAAGSLAFAATMGRAFSAVLPAATGEGTLTYSVSAGLPAGLAFDPATRTISGTPTALGTATLVYTVLDSDGDRAARTFTLTVREAQPVVGVARVLASPAVVRENGETTEIRVTATLVGAAPTVETVRFTMVPPASGAMATRNVDYTATLAGAVTIAAGETMGSTTLFLSPIDNAALDGDKYLGVRAAASGGWGQVDLRISDDETASTALVVSVLPSAISESAELTEVMVMAALDGQPLATEATVAISIDGAASSATRGTDYSVRFNPDVTIAVGSIMGSTRFLIDPVADGLAEGDETIILHARGPGLTSGSATLVLTDTDRGLMDDDEDMTIALAFVEGASVAARTYTAGTAMVPLVLPAARGGEGAITYSVADLPAGLSFDATTRTISGIPDAATAGAVEVTYTATAGDESVSLRFTITVNAMLDWGDLSALFDVFNSGAGKPVPLRAGLNGAARLYLDAPTALPSVGEEFVVDVRLADFVAVKGYGLQVAYDADQLTFVEARTDRRAWATPQVLADQAGVLTLAAHGDVVADGELRLRLVFRPTTEIAHTTLEITDNRTYDRALGFNRPVLPAPVALQTRPAVFSLAANYPNPFNPQTTIQYALPQAADVMLTVYNVLGQPVRTLVAEHQSAGRYAVEWDATNDSGHSVSSGMYFYRLQAGEAFLAIQKMLLLK